MAGRFVLTPAVGFLQSIEDALNDMKLTDLQDGPTTLVGHGGKFLKVKLDETGLEFIASSGVLSASDITVDDSGFLIIEGTNVQSALDSADARILQNYITNIMLMGS